MTRGPEVRDNLGALPLPHKFTLLSSFNRPPDPHMPYGAKNSAALPATHNCTLAHKHKQKYTHKNNDNYTQT